MRRQGMHVRAAPAVALMCAVAFGGCKKQEPPAPAEAVGVQDAGQAAAAAAVAKDAGTVAETPTPFAYKDVKLSHADDKVTLTYTLENHGAKRARGMSCLSLQDKDGYILANVTLGPISLRGGESDAFEDSKSVDASAWAEARTVRLYASDDCYIITSDALLSQVTHLDMAGQPAPKGAPAARTLASPEDGVPVFDLKEVGLSQESPSDSVVLTFTVTNTGTARMRASVCLRLYDSPGATGGIDEASSSDFTLAPGASKTVSTELTLDDEKNWDSTVLLRAYASNYGCANSARLAVSNVVELRKPAEIHSPRDDAAEDDANLGGDNSAPDEPLDEEPARAEDGVSDGQ